MELCIAVSKPVISEAELGYCTNLAFFKQVSTSGGRDEDICGCVAVAEASQFNGGCCTSVMISCSDSELMQRLIIMNPAKL